MGEQREIAGVLGALDDKIEANRRENATLEASARAMFKSWFVDFDPVRAKSEGERPAGMDAATAALFPDGFEDSELGPIPAGWSVGSLDDGTQIVVYSWKMADSPKRSGTLRLVNLDPFLGSTSSGGVRQTISNLR